MTLGLRAIRNLVDIASVSVAGAVDVGRRRAHRPTAEAPPGTHRQAVPGSPHSRHQPCRLRAIYILLHPPRRDFSSLMPALSGCAGLTSVRHSSGTMADGHVPDPRPIHAAFIAATALVHGMTVATRNVADFAATGVRVLNPWL